MTRASARGRRPRRREWRAAVARPAVPARITPSEEEPPRPGWRARRWRPPRAPAASRRSCRAAQSGEAEGDAEREGEPAAEQRRPSRRRTRASRSGRLAQRSRTQAIEEVGGGDDGDAARPGAARAAPPAAGRGRCRREVVAAVPVVVPDARPPRGKSSVRKSCAARSPTWRFQASIAAASAALSATAGSQSGRRSRAGAGPLARSRKDRDARACNDFKGERGNPGRPLWARPLRGGAGRPALAGGRPPGGRGRRTCCCCSSTRPSTRAAAAPARRSCRCGAEWYEMQGIEVHDTDRGGRVTYHGPGQLVAYPIVSLKPYGDDVHEYVRRLERVAIEALAAHGVAARTIEGLTGVWTEGEAPGPEAGTTRRARSARSGCTSAAASPRTGWRSTSTTTCSRSSGSSPAGSTTAGSPRSAASWAPSRTSSAFTDTVAARFARGLRARAGRDRAGGPGTRQR